MKIVVTSVMVNDQQKALKFYTEVLGFKKRTDVPMGEYSWLTVESTDVENGVELLLEPLAFAPAAVYQKALFDAGIPLTMFGVDDIEAEFERLLAKGVRFHTPPTNMGPVIIAVLDDTCGNLIQLAEYVN